MSVESTGPNCYDALEGLDEAIRGELNSDQRYVVVGGVVTGAIRAESSGFYHDETTLRATDPASAEPIVRENGTVRDVDVVILDLLGEDQSKAIKEAMKASIQKAVGQKMVVSVFGFDRREELTAAKRAVSVGTAWTSKRTIDEHGVLRYELYPLESVVPRSSYDPWRLETPNAVEVPILNPAGHVLAYRMRSISGLRSKDAEKVGAMEERIMADDRFVYAMRRGEFSSWRRFAELLEVMRDGNLPPHSMNIREGATRPEVGIARVKGRGLAWAESKKWIVDPAQQEWAQRILNFGVNAK